MPIPTDIQQSYQKVKELRGELDQKLQELYGGPGSLSADNQFYFDHTVYVGLLWTILATYTAYSLFVNR